MATAKLNMSKKEKIEEFNRLSTFKDPRYKELVEYILSDLESSVSGSGEGKSEKPSVSSIAVALKRKNGDVPSIESIKKAIEEKTHIVPSNIYARKLQNANQRHPHWGIPQPPNKLTINAYQSGGSGVMMGTTQVKKLQSYDELKKKYEKLGLEPKGKKISALHYDEWAEIPSKPSYIEDKEVLKDFILRKEGNYDNYDVASF